MNWSEHPAGDEIEAFIDANWFIPDQQPLQHRPRSSRYSRVPRAAMNALESVVQLYGAKATIEVRKIHTSTAYETLYTCTLASGDSAPSQLAPIRVEGEWECEGTAFTFPLAVARCLAHIDADESDMP